MSQDRVAVFRPFVPKESIIKVFETLHTTWIGGDGPRVKEFEKKISKIIDNENVLALNSGTSALHLALRVAGVKGGEVISSPMTCFATNAPIVNEGANIVWADINPETASIDPNDIAKKITKKTKAIIAVHWGGNPPKLDEINKIARRNKIMVIEDAAQSIGSEYKGKPIGSHSDFVCFSTQAIKIINTVDGGFIATRKKEYKERIRLLRWYGIDREKRIQGPTFWDYPIKEAGFKMQMTDVSASIGLGQLPYLKRLLAQRRRIARTYEKAIGRSKTLRYQKVLPEAKSNYWMFTVLCGNSKNRLKLWKALDEIGVDSAEGHVRNDLYPVFKKFKKGKLPGVTKFNDEKLVIPNGWWVTEEKVKQIADILASF